MFRIIKKAEDDELKRLLRVSWAAKSESEKGSFLHNLKIVIPPDHPGLLFLTGRLRKYQGNGNGHASDSFKWGGQNALSTAAAWALIIIVAASTVYLFSYIFRPSDRGVSSGLGGNNGIAIDNNNLEQATDVARYIYTFHGFRIETPGLLTLAEAIVEMERIRPDGWEFHINGMDQVDEYYEESNGVRFHCYVYELQGEKSVMKGEGAKKDGFEGY